MIEVSPFQNAILAEGVDAWLFAGFHHRDPLSERLLKLPADSLNTRPWYYIVPASGEPVRIVHAIERGALDALPGRLRAYATRDELLAIFAELPKGSLAAQYSTELPIVSFLDHGTAGMLEEAGFSLVSSAGLIQRMIGVASGAGLESHERAARHLYDIVRLVWARIEEAFRAGTRLTEGHVQAWILSELAGRGLVCDHPPIVGAGAHSSDPHYEPAASGGSVLDRGQVVQLDLWAKEEREEGIYADISWVGVLAERASTSVEAAFGALREARDGAVALVKERLASGRAVSGFEVDAEVRAALAASGYSRGLRHRTGHAIDGELHGSGVNLDSVEFPDRRPILEGSCFSVEPGLYLGDFGLRTEIDLYVRNREVHVSGGPPQSAVLLLR